MATAVKPGGAAAPKPSVNRIGLTKPDYRGLPSTLCAGCGHDSIASQIIQSAFELALQPHMVIKLSGIGCSSKSPAYFLSRSHGINAVHGRMPSVATGAMLAHRHMLAIGVSGDGDTGSIGLGQFKHLVRRNVPMVYIIENNGVYGLTKGQFSATADLGQTLKYAGTNELMPIDLCLEALIAECGFVARSFAGDAKQVRELLKAAMSYRGTAVLDIISPCVTFNNHPESTKSYPYGKEHEEILQDIHFVPAYEEIQIEQEEGTVQEVKLHDGPTILLRKLRSRPGGGSDANGKYHDPTDKEAAIRLLLEARERQELITGLIYINESRPTFLDIQRLPDEPLARLPEAKLRSSPERLAAVMQEFA
ncbi:2-oxoacid:ferredoxin oxidoreductase subunit beta [Kallotenue papyrolyticum]|uniref:2-oxoacid:ferredoxin oxidoreductase subunit beta n=1 Tax=Kallotenue papyrolyticum TaxID=1325125 RepID=UPI0004923A94|nr:2-oxoacid:ferredoxin oxidoreductase subunit beta [Kallotenue papyrolyticum]